MRYTKVFIWYDEIYIYLSKYIIIQIIWFHDMSKYKSFTTKTSIKIYNGDSFTFYNNPLYVLSV